MKLEVLLVKHVFGTEQNRTCLTGKHVTLLLHIVFHILHNKLNQKQEVKNEAVKKMYHY